MIADMTNQADLGYITHFAVLIVVLPPCFFAKALGYLVHYYARRVAEWQGRYAQHSRETGGLGRVGNPAKRDIDKSPSGGNNE